MTIKISEEMKKHIKKVREHAHDRVSFSKTTKILFNDIPKDMSDAVKEYKKNRIKESNECINCVC